MNALFPGNGTLITTGAPAPSLLEVVEKSDSYFTTLLAEVTHNWWLNCCPHTAGNLIDLEDLRNENQGKKTGDFISRFTIDSKSTCYVCSQACFGNTWSDLMLEQRRNCQKLVFCYWDELVSWTVEFSYIICRTSFHRRSRNKRQILTCCRDFGTKEWKSEGREVVLGTLLKLIVKKDKLLHSGKYHVNVELRPWGERNEKRKSSDTTLWTRRWRCDGITINFYTGLPHIYFHTHNFFHACPFIA